jgi:diacylglycerol kinase family enzyme
MPIVPTDPLERLADSLERSAPSKRMLMIVNPYATTVSDRLKNLVVYALQGRYEVDAIETQARDHATELCQEAARERYDVVVAFGGDGTVNEAANGLAGSGTPLTCLPGGRTNVYCRMLGIPTDVVDATEHLLRLADDWHPRRVDIAHVNDRHFLFSAGAGLDASVVAAVDAHARLKARYGEWYYTAVGVRTFARRYLFRPVRLEVTLDGMDVTGVSAIVQNGTPYTYFGRARSTSRRSCGAPCRVGPWSLAIAGCTRSPGSPGCASARSMTGRCRSRSTATTSAPYPRRRSG